MDKLITQLEHFANHNIVPYVYNILTALVIFVVGKWIVGKIAGWLERIMDRHMESTVARFMANILNVMMVVFVVIAALSQLGIETNSLVAILGAASLAVGLSLKDSLANFAAGVMLIVFRPFKVGDYIEAAGTAGTAKEIKIFASVLVTPDNKVITVPNGGLMGGMIVNYSTMPTRRVDMQVGVSYDADLSRVKEILLDIVRQDKRVLKDPEPVVAVSELADSSVNLLLRPWVKSADYWSVKWDTTEMIKKRLDEANISIPFPQMHIHVNNLQK